MKQDSAEITEANDAGPAAGSAEDGAGSAPRTYAERWNHQFAQLESFIRAHGHWRVPANSEEFQKLAEWLGTQRQLARRDCLAPERREKLERLNITFDLRKRRWEAMFAELAEFKARHGHCRVSRETPDLIALANWLQNQVAALRLRQLRSDRLKRLRQLGWSPRPPRRRPRKVRTRLRNNDRMFAALAAFKQRFGHCRVPDRWPSNRRLAEWLAHLRYLGRRQALPPELRDRLLQLGVVFGETQPQRWELRFAALQDYVKRFGDWRVPKHWAENPMLAQWLRWMRCAGRRGKLDPARRQRLAALGVSFEPDPTPVLYPALETRWEDHLRSLAQFKERFGHCRVPYTWPENQSLATWFALQLRKWRRGRLRPDRQERLARLGARPENRRHSPALSPQRQQRWEEYYAALVNFHQQTGHCSVPDGYPPKPSLGEWVRFQRTFYRQGRMRPERFQKLNALGFLQTHRWPTAAGRPALPAAA